MLAYFHILVPFIPHRCPPSPMEIHYNSTITITKKSQFSFTNSASNSNKHLGSISYGNGLKYNMQLVLLTNVTSICRTDTHR